MEHSLTPHPQSRPANPANRNLWITAAAVALATVFGVFVLPFFFPPTHLALSASYSSGFNNRVAAVAAAVMAAVTFASAWRSGSAPSPAAAKAPQPISRKFLAASLAASALFPLALGWVLTTAVVAYNDNLYFIEYMDEVATYHLHIYKDFSFLYGPLLLYFPLAVHMLLRPFHAGVQASYFVALALMQLLGVLLLYFTLGALPLSRSLKTITLGLFTVSVFCPHLGINYTLVRSLLPFSTLLFIARVRRPLAVAALFFLGELLQLAVSPELAVAFAAGACFYALCQSITASRLYLVALLAPPAAFIAFLEITGKIYLDSIAQFSTGFFNLIVEPLPYIFFFLFALVWLVPRMIAGMVRHRSPLAIPMLSLFVVSVALVPAALGRCDPLHVFFNGAGVYLLAVLAVSSAPEHLRNLWLLGLALVLLSMQNVNATLFREPILQAKRIAIHSSSEQVRRQPWFLNLQALEPLVAHGKASVPFDIPLIAEEELKRAGLYQPDRNCFYIGISDLPAETARVQRMDRTEWAIVPTHAGPTFETADTSRKVLGSGFSYPQRRPPFFFGKLLLADLAEHWTPAAENENWILYHNDQLDPALPGK